MISRAWIVLRLYFKHADILLLMSVAVSLLSKSLVAVLAHEWSLAAVHVDVFEHVAQLGEGVAAGGADQELIWAARVLVLLKQLHVTSCSLFPAKFFVRVVLKVVGHFDVVFQIED